jgi:hypothetical protein
MVLEKEVRSFIWNGIRVQYFDDVVAAAKQTTTRDNKERVPWDKHNKVTVTPLPRKEIDPLDDLEENYFDSSDIDPEKTHADGVAAFNASAKNMQMRGDQEERSNLFLT